jgi:rhodanese-related sulfurtransferase
MAIKQIAPTEAYELIRQGYRYVDVRTEAEFSAGHPAEAVNIPVVVPDPSNGQMRLNPDFVAVIEAHFTKDKPLVIGCLSGGRSQRAAEMLATLGYTRLHNMQGGFGGARDPLGRTVAPGWQESGLPICRDCDPANAYASLRAAK